MMQAMTDLEVVAALGSADEHHRALAAVEMARRGHPAALEACLRTLGDDGHLPHADMTPAVSELIAIGGPALWPLLERMLSSESMTRLHASVAVREICKRRFGYDGRRWPQGWYVEWSAWWRRVDYRHDAPPRSRAVAVERIRDLVGRVP